MPNYLVCEYKFVAFQLVSLPTRIPMKRKPCSKTTGLYLMIMCPTPHWWGGGGEGGEEGQETHGEEFLCPCSEEEEDEEEEQDGWNCVGLVFP